MRVANCKMQIAKCKTQDRVYLIGTLRYVFILNVFAGTDAGYEISYVNHVQI